MRRSGKTALEGRYEYVYVTPVCLQFRGQCWCVGRLLDHLRAQPWSIRQDPSVSKYAVRWRPDEKVDGWGSRDRGGGDKLESGAVGTSCTQGGGCGRPILVVIGIGCRARCGSRRVVRLVAGKSLSRSLGLWPLTAARDRTNHSNSALEPDGDPGRNSGRHA